MMTAIDTECVALQAGTQTELLSEVKKTDFQLSTTDMLTSAANGRKKYLNKTAFGELL